MPVDPRDLRSLVAEIRGALDTHSKEEVAEILTYVFKEYVVEGPLPLARGAATVVEAKGELDGLSFAQLIQWLQLHHDAPELALFDVQGERVSVRIGGRLTPLEAQAARPEPLPPQTSSAPLQQAAPQPQPATPVTQAATARIPAQPAAPTPQRPAAQPAAQTPAQAPAQPAAAQPQQQKQEQKEESGDSSRFSLLEID